MIFVYDNFFNCQLILLSQGCLWLGLAASGAFPATQQVDTGIQRGANTEVRSCSARDRKKVGIIYGCLYNTRPKAVSFYFQFTFSGLGFPVV